MVGIVFNPVSGGGKSRDFTKEAARLLSSMGRDYRFYESTVPGGIKEKTREAVHDGAESILLAGGDGSLSEAASELNGTKTELLLLPCGTGNDFARSLRLPEDPVEALRAQLSGNPKRIDCGLVNGRAFVNVSGSGFDVDVLQRYEELKTSLPGERAYRRAVMQVIAQYRPFAPRIEIDGQPVPDGRYAIAEVANGQFFGGGMKVAPDARIDDGFFDVVLVRAVPRMCIPMLLPLFILGIHTRIPLAKVIRAHSVLIHSPGMTVNIDGQLEKMDEAYYEIIPGGLNMRLPA